MKPILVSGAKSKGGHWLIALHEAHDHIAADEDQPLDHTVGGNDVVRVRQRDCGDVGEGGGHRQADLDDSCGDADDGDGLDEFPTGVEGAQAQLDDGAPTEIEPGQDKEGDELRDGGGQGGPLHPHAQAPVKHEYRVQHHIQKGPGDDGDGRDLHGGLCPCRAVHALGRQIGQGRHKHPEGVVLGQREGGVRGAEHPHQRLDKCNAAHAQHHADDDGQADDGGDSAAGTLLVLSPQMPPRQYSGSGGEDVFDGHHNEKQRHGDAHRCQSNIRIQHPDVGSVHDVVDCLRQQGQCSGKGELDDGFRGIYISQNRS